MSRLSVTIEDEIVAHVLTEVQQGLARLDSTVTRNQRETIQDVIDLAEGRVPYDPVLAYRIGLYIGGGSEEHFILGRKLLGIVTLCNPEATPFERAEALCHVQPSFWSLL